MSTDENVARVIAMNLKRLAYDHGKTQADIARDLSLNKQTLSTWMNGQRIPRMPKVDLLCHYFNCKRSDILEPYVPKPIDKSSAFEKNLVNAYRMASEDNKRIVKYALGLVEESE